MRRGENRLQQMSVIQEIIAKKKREILEKKQNAETIAAIAANMPENTKEKTETTETKSLPDTNVRNTFYNDGSFLENFKKSTTKIKIENAIDDETKKTAAGEKDIDDRISIIPVKQESLEDDANHATPTIINHQSAPDFIIDRNTPTFMEFSRIYSIPEPQHYVNSSMFPSTSSSLTTLNSIEHFRSLQSISPPKSIVLHEIPAPKALDLNAIPPPQLNLDAIKIPELSTITKVFSDNDIIPTTLEQLIEMVAEKGDAFEDKLRLQKNDVHSSLWFLFAKDSEAYQNYHQLVTKNRQLKQNNKYDPAEIYNNNKDDDDDSDYEYMKEAKERNLNNMKRKLTNRRSEYYSSESNSDDDDDEERFERYQKGKDVGDKESEPESDSKLSNTSRIKKKSRWGDKVEIVEPPSVINQNMLMSVQPPPLTHLLPPPLAFPSFENHSKPLLKSITRTDPALLFYARQNFGSIDLSEDDWKKAEEHFKINLLYQDMLKKRNEMDRMAKSGKFKYEYDSDEDTTGGTWEHKLRSAEMEATTIWAEALNKQSEGKHHIGDFLPPEELKKFMEQYDAKKNNREPDISDYKEYKLKEDNIGFQMLQRLGWKEGQGLGQGGSGITDPINKSAQQSNAGLGSNEGLIPGQDDDEYDSYRKRMMMAYRFRPNPLNNPRRAYY